MMQTGDPFELYKQIVLPGVIFLCAQFKGFLDARATRNGNRVERTSGDWLVDGITC